MGLLSVIRSFGLIALLSRVGAAPAKQESKAFLKQVGNTTWVIGNGIWNMTQGRQYGTKLWYKGKDRVGTGVGHYVSYNGAASDLNWTSATIVEEKADYINVKFTAKEGDFHWVIHHDLAGAYQYFVNHALPTLGEFRTLWRLDNASFPNGHTSVKDGALPPLSEYAAATKVQDETWQKADGTFLTKYDWSAFIREQTYYGVYGDEVGSWYINPGKDYYNGDHLKQELMIHRESQLGEAVQLNMIHGTHYMARSSDVFPDGKTWGPWLWYLNDGSKDDVSSRATEEFKAWPYKWFQDAAYRSRGSIEGKLTLSDGRPAAGAAVFLGDNNSNLSSLDQGANYYYITYADNDGKFLIRDVRTGTYGIEAWSNGGKIGDVSTTFKKNDIIINDSSKTKLKSMTWSIPDKKNRIFQVGDFDRKTIGFKLSGPTPFEHGRISHCPANLTYMVGQSQYADWCFGQSALGTHSIVFSVSSIPTTATKAKLTVSLAGFSSGSNANILLNEAKIGNITGSSVLLPSSQDTYRGATQAGEWHLLEFLVPKNQVKVGQNRFDFRVTSSTMWRGWLWDSVVFEWV